MLYVIFGNSQYLKLKRLVRAYFKAPLGVMHTDILKVVVTLNKKKYRDPVSL